MRNFTRSACVILTTAIFALSCEKKMGRKEVGDNLMAAMNHFMNFAPGADTTKLKFNAKDVAFYEEKTFYRCEFQVEMIQKTNTTIKDTTGKMAAIITKDFQKVTRTF